MAKSQYYIIVSIIIAAQLRCVMLYCQPQSPCSHSWFVEDNSSGICQPGHDIGYLLNYDANTEEVNLACSCCMTRNESSNITYIGKCPSNSLKLKTTFMTNAPANSTEINAKFCGRHYREGLLCKDCIQGYGPAVLTDFSRCVKCNKDYAWVLFLIQAFLPVTLFLITILALKIDAVSPKLNALIFWSQSTANILFLNPSCFYSFSEYNRNFPVLFRIGRSIIEIWNMNFVRYEIPQICLSPKLDMLGAVALEYLVALYPLGFTALLYYVIQLHDSNCRLLVWMCRPVYRVLHKLNINLDIKTSVLHSFITFLVLSYSKFLTISVSILRVTDIYDSCGNKIGRPVVYLNPGIKAFSPAHLLFAIPAIAMIVFANVLPILYTFMYTLSQIRPFLDIFFRSMLWKELAKSSQRHFKDGSNGTRDCRTFASLYLLARCIFVVIILERLGTLLMILLSLGLGLLILGCKPYKVAIYNYIDLVLIFSVTGSSFIFFLAQLSFITTKKEFMVFYVFLLIPLVYYIALVCCFIAQKIGLTKLFARCFRKLFPHQNPAISPLFSMSRE